MLRAPDKGINGTREPFYGGTNDYKSCWKYHFRGRLSPLARINLMQLGAVQSFCGKKKWTFPFPQLHREHVDSAYLDSLLPPKEIDL